MSSIDEEVNDGEELLPGYPDNPEYYRGRPDDDPEKLYFLRRGARYKDGAYLGGFGAPAKEGDDE